jgi:uncharacterized membrane protein (UPF0127 family)
MNDHKEVGIGVIIAGILLAVAVAFIVIVMPSLMQPTTTLKLGQGVFKATVYKNDGKDKIASPGSKNQVLDSDQALLIVFPSDGRWQISLEKVDSPVDVIWLDSKKQVVHIVKNVTLANSTVSQLIYNRSARYVVELPAGTVDSEAIGATTIADFQIQ